MLFRPFYALRNIHLSRQIFNAEVSPLAHLRKKTGYTLSNCKKALELHDNDSQKAEEWLHSQAKAEGWAKVTKLKTRETAQGLIGLICNDNTASMVEVNCETDFVARNENFQNLVASASLSAFHYGKNKEISGNGLTKTILSQVDLENLKCPQNPSQTLADLTALTVGRLSENISLKRAICINVSSPLLLSGYCHPPDVNLSGITMGKFGGIVIYKKTNDNRDTQERDTTENDDTDKSELTLEEIGRHLSVHIVGMNPTQIGSKSTEGEDEKVDRSTMLIYQECISDPEIQMGEFLDENGVEVLDFVRFQCGEDVTPLADK